MRRKARRLALAEAPILFLSVALCWQNVKFCECLLGMPSFQCIGGGNVPPPMPCLHAGPGGAPKGAWPGLGGGADSFFSVSYCVGKTLKVCECLLATPSFQCIGGGSVPPPTACRTLGRAMRRKARRLALAVEPSLYLSFVLCLQNVKFCACLLAMPSFQCIGAAACRPQWLAARWAGRRAERRLAWPRRTRRAFIFLSYCVRKT